eukprot:scaffold158039_cov29-Tisochrysis_lutea.AAC.6
MDARDPAATYWAHGSAGVTATRCTRTAVLRKQILAGTFHACCARIVVLLDHRWCTREPCSYHGLPTGRLPHGAATVLGGSS